MQKLIAKYGLAAHLALLAVAPQFFSLSAAVWLAALTACWLFLEPSRLGQESLSAARQRVLRSVLSDPLFWIMMLLTLVAAVRMANGGVGQWYDAESGEWVMRGAAVGSLPGSVDGGGRMEFAACLVITVVLAYTFTVLSGLFAYSFSSAWFPSLLDRDSLDVIDAGEVKFPAYFTLAIPPLADIMTCLVLSFMLGIGIATSKAQALRKGFEELKAIIVRSIEKIIIPVLPFYIFGLFLDMTAAGQVAPVLKSFLVMVGVIFGMTILLLVLQYCIAGAVAGKNPFKMLAGMLPAVRQEKRREGGSGGLCGASLRHHPPFRKYPKDHFLRHSPYDYAGPSL